ARAFIPQASLVRRSASRRSPEEPGNVLSKNVQCLARRVPSRDPLGIGWKDGKVAIPTGRQFAPLHQLDLVSELGIFRSISGEEFGPLPPRISPARSYSGSKMLVDAVGHKELRVLGPAVAALGEPDLLISEWLAVCRGRVLLVRRAVADVTIQNNEGVSFLGLSVYLKVVLVSLYVVGVPDTQHGPAI